MKTNQSRLNTLLHQIKSVIFSCLYTLRDFEKKDFTGCTSWHKNIFKQLSEGETEIEITKMVNGKRMVIHKLSFVNSNDKYYCLTKCTEISPNNEIKLITKLYNREIRTGVIES